MSAKPVKVLVIGLCVLAFCAGAVYVTLKLTWPTGLPDTPAIPRRGGGGATTGPNSQPAATGPAGPWRSAAVSTMVKVFRDEPLPAAAAPAAEVALARGEIEGVQIAIAAGQQDLKGVRVTVGELRGPGGAPLPAKCVSWNVVGYVQTNVPRPYETTKVGYWPDPLLPPGPFDVGHGQVQPIWLNVSVPPGTPAGLYEGAVTVDAGDAQARQVPLRVRVWDFDLPRSGHLKTLCWMDPQTILHFHGLADMDAPGAVDLVKRYAALSLRNRLGPGGTIGCGFNWDRPQWPVRKADGKYDFAQAEAMLQFAFDGGMNCFLLAVVPNLKRTGWAEYSPEWKLDFRDLVSNYLAFLRTKGWDQQAYVDNFSDAPRACWPLVKESYQVIKGIDPKCRVIQWLNEPEGVAALAGFADAWGVYVAQYDRTGAAELRKAGQEVWWSVCLFPKDHPNLFIDYPAIDARILGWLSWKYGLSGFAYWSTVSWGKANTLGDAGHRWPETPWQTDRFAGDGYLCYPGPDRTPLSSVRFENLRDGIEDYEYLWLLRQKLPALSPADQSAAAKLLAIDAPLAKSNLVYTDDPTVILARRSAIATLLERKTATTSPVPATLP
jgi:hypothetical protein